MHLHIIMYRKRLIADVKKWLGKTLFADQYALIDGRRTTPMYMVIAKNVTISEESMGLFACLYLFGYTSTGECAAHYSTGRSAVK